MVTANLYGLSSWQVPANVTEIRLYGHGNGGGGSGGRGSLGVGGRGGGGAAYCDHTITVTPGETLTIISGSPGSGSAYSPTGASPAAGGDGGDVEVRRGATVLYRAAGGKGGVYSVGAGAGGSAGDCIGTIKNPGSSGSNNSAGTGGAGGNAASPGGGTGGIGGSGSPSNAGQPGGPPGAGGGGGRNLAGGNGGNGAAGTLTVEYTVVVTVYDYGRVAVAGAPRVARQPQIKKSGVMRNIREAYIVKSGVPRVMFRDVTGEGPVDPEDPPPAGAAPSYVPAGHEAKYSVGNHMFNVNSGNSARLKASLQDSDFTRTEWVHLGDSAGDGFNNMNTHNGPNAYILKTRDKLVADGVAELGGTGLVRARTATLLAHHADDRWKKYNTNTISPWKWQNFYHYVQCQNRLSGYQLIFESDKPGTRIDVAYLDRGPIEVIVDDGAVTYTIPGTGTNVPMVHTRTGLANTIHKVQLAVGTHAQQVAIAAAEVYNPTGLVVHNFSQGGAKVDVNKSGQDVWSDISHATDRMLPFYSDLKPDPDVVWIQLGGNDMRDPINYTGIQDGFKRLIDAYPNSDKILVMMTEGDVSFTGDFERHRRETMQTALDKDVMLVDTHSILGGLDNMIANGWNGDQYGHLNVTGATYLGHTIATGMKNVLGL